MHRVVSCVSQAEAEEIDERVFGTANYTTVLERAEQYFSSYVAINSVAIIFPNKPLHCVLDVAHLIQSFLNDFCSKFQLAITYGASVILSHSSAASYLVLIYWIFSLKMPFFGLRFLVFF